MKKNDIEIITHGKEYIEEHIEEKSIIICPECFSEYVKLCKIKEESKKWIFNTVTRYDKCICRNCGCVFITNKTKKISGISKVEVMKRLMFLSVFILALCFIYYILIKTCLQLDEDNIFIYNVWVISLISSMVSFIYSLLWFAFDD